MELNKVILNRIKFYFLDLASRNEAALNDFAQNERAFHKKISNIRDFIRYGLHISLLKEQFGLTLQEAATLIESFPELNKKAHQKDGYKSLTLDEREQFQRAKNFREKVLPYLADAAAQGSMWKEKIFPQHWSFSQGTTLKIGSHKNNH